ncbi:methylmalonyl Co-A mutase-associated GTPase MeaB [Magnetospirillum sulfuroxidans]|uniref:Methylmalonyl Co-A mutase-associated GTPase MeaB n=1 Tax=Magnetospirillum sulfuroxidans TaxID=611300 RepID=A0ABS5IGG0_9PROT|nr:methylmalonyl Co-A mutase-associated GTPase MeaB [Magnetospirillum sulfuroxidans]MBR9972798.1 methylmalonyl Co-A mutase-associated GTPase MeaB [Magnetospirillum sulfuroxidans]
MSVDPIALAKGVLAGDRRSVARAITLIESTRVDHREAAEALLHEILPHSGRSIRVGITGVPGAGKSTFIEAFGLHVVEQGHKLAVLAVDPSSPRTGGSILGDKTRMEELSRDIRAFIRPSPSSCTLGGVARRTREAMLVCEAAGFDVVVVETVGVGQSETAVADMVDMFLLLLVPGGGDELQGIKKGIVELADAIVVNKADGDLAQAAKRAAQDYSNALHLLTPASAAWAVPVLTCSALERAGVADVWSTIGQYRDTMQGCGRFSGRRAEQAQAWMWNEIAETLLQTLKDDNAVAALLPTLERQVTSGLMAPTVAARRLVHAFRHN